LFEEILFKLLFKRNYENCAVHKSMISSKVCWFMIEWQWQ